MCTTYVNMLMLAVVGLIILQLCGLLPCLAGAVDPTLDFSNEITNEYDPCVTSSNLDNQCQNRSWLKENSCECGDDLDGIIYCFPSKDVYIKSQYCMSVYDGHGYEVVGRCPYTYVKFIDHNISNIGLYYKVPEYNFKLEKNLCDPLNRRGLLCGKCKEGYGYVMYPHIDANCVVCNPDSYVQNWVKYIAISFVPLTLFLVLVICLRVNAASASMNAFVFISQVISQPPFARGFIDTINSSLLSDSAKGFLRFLHCLYGIWNLDFFVSMIPHFCLPHQSIFSAIALMYGVAFYPLVLLVLVYLSIELYSRDIRVLIWLWKPFKLCYTRFRRHWDVRASVIDAFATFILLSYVKVLFVSIDLLAPTELKRKDGTTVGVVSYFDASFSLSPSNSHTILIMFGIFLVTIIFTLLPAILLLLYPWSLCQRCLNHTRLHFQPLHFVMNSFNGCFKDGTTSRLDCRFFAAVYLLIRVIISVEYVVLYFNYYTSVIITCVVLIIAIAAVKPYRKQYSRFNRIDPLMIFFLVVWLASYKDIRTAAGNNEIYQHIWFALCFISLILPLISITLYSINFRVLKRWYRSRKRASHLLEDSLEQRSHMPHTPHLSTCEYINAEFELEQDTN